MSSVMLLYLRMNSKRAIGQSRLIYKVDVLKLLHTLKKIIPETFFTWQIQNVM